MGDRGESAGVRVQGNLRIEWSEQKGVFLVQSTWFAVDARGMAREVVGMDEVKRVPDDEFTERTLTRTVRRLAAEAKALQQERLTGVQRLV